MKTILFALSIAFSVSSCSPEKTTETPVQNESTNNIEISSDNTIIGFMIPDSINTNLIIATYVEVEPESHTILVYKNDSKKSVNLIRYYDNGKVTTDKLDVVAENKFKLLSSNEEYVLNDTAVIWTKLNGANAITKSHFRTDANY